MGFVLDVLPDSEGQLLASEPPVQTLFLIHLCGPQLLLIVFKNVSATLLLASVVLHLHGHVSAGPSVHLLLGLDDPPRWRETQTPTFMSTR